MEKQVEIPAPKRSIQRCPYCRGKGYTWNGDKKCHDCNGTGERCVDCLEPRAYCGCPR